MIEVETGAEIEAEIEAETGAERDTTVTGMKEKEAGKDMKDWNEIEGEDP